MLFKKYTINGLNIFYEEERVTRATKIKLPLKLFLYPNFNYYHTFTRDPFTPFQRYISSLLCNVLINGFTI
jgi:hypothetical protein